MSDFPTLADVHDKHIRKDRHSCMIADCVCGWSEDVSNTHKTTRRLHSEHVERCWRKACTITIVKQLSSLHADPNLLGGPVIKAFGVPAFGDIYEANDDGTWNELGGRERTPAEDIPLPAVLVWHPSWGVS